MKKCIICDSEINDNKKLINEIKNSKKKFR